MPVEERSLSSRRTQQVARDLEIGQPNNSEKCSEAADGVARESEGSAGVVATACTQGKRTQHGKPQGVVRDDQPDAREGGPGALGWRRGSLYRGSRVMPVEGRDLSSRRTHYVVRDMEIG